VLERLARHLCLVYCGNHFNGTPPLISPFNQSLFFCFLFANIGPLHPAHEPFLCLNHIPVAATSSLNHRDQRFAFGQLIDLFRLAILARIKTGTLRCNDQAGGQGATIHVANTAASRASLRYSTRRFPASDSLSVRHTTYSSPILAEVWGKNI